MSKKNRTLNQLVDNLDDELGWRIKDLNTIKNQIPSSTNPNQGTMIRAGVTMLYAHWEGFVKAAATHYLK
jgi:MAE_28990/MAE_18760-like HEPN